MTATLSLLALAVILIGLILGAWAWGEWVGRDDDDTPLGVG